MDVLKRILRGKQRITFNVTNNEGKEVKVVLEGSGMCCKEIRDNIVVWGPNGSWVQGDLYREMLEEEGE
jgi:hypothetical protein